jgi:hypothetical protein
LCGTGRFPARFVIRNSTPEARDMVLSTTSLLLLVVLLVLVLGAVPSWPHSRSWGYWPSGTIGTVLVIVLIFALLGYL